MGGGGSGVTSARARVCVSSMHASVSIASTKHELSQNADQNLHMTADNSQTPSLRVTIHNLADGKKLHNAQSFLAVAPATESPAPAQSAT